MSNSTISRNARIKESKPWYLCKMRGDKFFWGDHIIQKFFRDHHDDEGLDELIRWQILSKSEFFGLSLLQTFYQKFLQRRKKILDPLFKWTPENKKYFVEFNRQIHRAEQDIFKHLIVMRRTLKELYESGQEYLFFWETKSRIEYTGGYIENEHDDFPTMLERAIPETHLSKFVRNSYTLSEDYGKLERPTKDWAYEFNDSQKECASIEAFKKLPLHKHAGFLMFDSGTYALQDFVNMYIRFEAFTEIHYGDSREA